MGKESLKVVSSAQRPSLPRRMAGGGLVAKIVVVALLAVAVFFYVRAVMPPGEEGRDNVAVTGQKSPTEGAAPASPAGTPAAAEATDEARPSGLDPKMVTNLKAMQGTESDPPPAAPEAVAPAVETTVAAGEQEPPDTAPPRWIPNWSMPCLR